MTFYQTDFQCSKNTLLTTAFDILGSTGFDIETSDSFHENMIVCSNNIFNHKKYRFRVRISTNEDDTRSTLILDSLPGSNAKDYIVLEKILKKIEKKLDLLISV